MFFHHLDPSQVKRPTRLLLKKIEKFKFFLSNHPTFQTKILNYGDGLSISYQNERFHEGLFSLITALSISDEKHIETK
jgi:hypothetical protein